MNDSLLALGIEAIERGWVPDPIAQMAIRRLCGMRLAEAAGKDSAANHMQRRRLLAAMRSGPLAASPEAANEQHYELPAEFFAAMLGPRLKYSCCFWPSATATLADAEDAALELTCQRADLHDGQEVLELGCGWGSLSLWMAERYPRSRITAVSNSASQGQFIAASAAERNLTNLRVVTADVNDLNGRLSVLNPSGFDRVVSVEMFEHMRNYELLLAQIASWLKPDGKLFVHIFCHRQAGYLFDAAGPANWMGRHFFTAGLMPSQDLLASFNRDLRVSEQWTWNGHHYRRTAAAWLANFDANRARIMPMLRSNYGQALAGRWWNRWRLFLLAVAELFGYDDGNQWLVAHYLLEPTARPSPLEYPAWKTSAQR